MAVGKPGAVSESFKIRSCSFRWPATTEGNGSRFPSALFYRVFTWIKQASLIDGSKVDRARIIKEMDLRRDTVRPPFTFASAIRFGVTVALIKVGAMSLLISGVRKLPLMRLAVALAPLLWYDTPKSSVPGDAMTEITSNCSQGLPIVAKAMTLRSIGEV